MPPPAQNAAAADSLRSAALAAEPQDVRRPGARMNGGAPKDSRGVYFGCGAALGFLAGFVGVLVAPATNIAEPILGGLGTAIIFGALAVLFGNKFFERLPWLRL